MVLDETFYRRQHGLDSRSMATGIFGFAISQKLLMTAEVMQHVAALLFQDVPDRHSTSHVARRPLRQRVQQALSAVGAEADIGIAEHLDLLLAPSRTWPKPDIGADICCITNSISPSSARRMSS